MADLHTLGTAELRHLAIHKGIRSIGGRAVKFARKPQLVTILETTMFRSQLGPQDISNALHWEQVRLHWFQRQGNIAQADRCRRVLERLEAMVWDETTFDPPLQG